MIDAEFEYVTGQRRKSFTGLLEKLARSAKWRQHARTPGSTLRTVPIRDRSLTYFSVSFIFEGTLVYFHAGYGNPATRRPSDLSRIPSTDPDLMSRS